LRWLRLAVVLYSLGALGDNLLTYKYVVVERRFYEANPFTAPRVYTQPLWMWFLYDLAAFVFALVAALGYYRLMLWLSRRDPPSRRARILRVASKYWAIVLFISIIRFLPVIHNVLLIYFGIETPLSELPYFLSKFLGG